MLRAFLTALNASATLAFVIGMWRPVALSATRRQRLKAMTDRASIDAAFAAMADDPAYLAEAETICEEFAAADWEALQIAEAEGRCRGE
ncbi:MAG: hypothetical protein ACRD5G_10120 [Candidatus Acidiferrales bacterium]